MPKQKYLSYVMLMRARADEDRHEHEAMFGPFSNMQDAEIFSDEVVERVEEKLEDLGEPYDPVYCTVRSVLDDASSDEQLNAYLEDQEIAQQNRRERRSRGRMAKRWPLQAQIRAAQRAKGWIQARDPEDYALNLTHSGDTDEDYDYEQPVDDYHTLDSLSSDVAATFALSDADCLRATSEISNTESESCFLLIGLFFDSSRMPVFVIADKYQRPVVLNRAILSSLPNFFQYNRKGDSVFLRVKEALYIDEAMSWLSRKGFDMFIAHEVSASESN